MREMQITFESIVGRIADMRPSEVRREILRTLKHRGWWEASVLVSHYIADVHQDGGVEGGIQDLCRTTSLTRATLHRYLAAGRLVIRRLAILGPHPIPAHLRNSPMAMAQYSEVIRCAKRLKVDPLDMVLVLEREYPLLTVDEIRSRSLSAKVWDAAKKPDSTEDISSFIDRVLESRQGPDATEVEWGFISTDGVYRAASGSMERVVGCRWREITAGADVVMDGEMMTCREAWYYMVRNAVSDQAGLPMHMFWPDVAMENLVLVITQNNMISGFLILDFSDEDALKKLNPLSFRNMRERCAAICAQLEGNFPSELVSRQELGEKYESSQVA
jgi:hypothetical protein